MATRSSRAWLVLFVAALLTGCGGGVANTAPQTSTSQNAAASSPVSTPASASLPPPNAQTLAPELQSLAPTSQARWRDAKLASLSSDEKTAWLGPNPSNVWVSPNTNKFENFNGHETEGYVYTPIIPPIAAAASWDPDVAFSMGNQMGKEMFANGYSFGFGVGMNIVSDPLSERTFEYWGEDPVLSGLMAAQHILGLQSPDNHALESVKHYVGNETEANRFDINHIFDRRSLHEIHLLPFEIAIKQGHPGGIMCAYGFISGVHACEDSYLQNEVVKNQWGFDGFVYTDCCNFATPTGDEVATFNAGTDVTWPIDTGDRQAAVTNLRAGLVSGALSPGRLDEAVRRRLQSFARVQGVQRPATPETTSSALFTQSRTVSQQLSERSMVLLKNGIPSGNSAPVLPLDASNANLKIALFAGYVESNRGIFWGGGSAGATDPLGASICTPTCFTDSLLQDLRAMVSNPNNVNAYASSDLSANGSTATHARQADVAIVIVRRGESEGSELSNLDSTYGENQLIPLIASNCSRVIVIIESGTAMTMPWLSQVQGVLDAWYPGENGGKAIANILFGVTNPSGKLPLTFPAAVSDLPLQSTNGGQVPSSTSDYTRFDPKVGYRWFDAMNIQPLFPFGFGLSYTTFQYSDFHVNTDDQGRVTASFTLSNTGTRDGAEVAQLYAALPDDGFEPPKRLVGWKKVSIRAGQSATVSIAVDPLFLKIWDVSHEVWHMPQGDFTFMIAASSRDIRASQIVNLQQTPPPDALQVTSITPPITTFAGVRQTYEIRGFGLDGDNISASLGGIACTERSKRYDRIFRAYCQAPATAASQSAMFVVQQNGQPMFQQSISVQAVPAGAGGYLRVDEFGEPMGSYDLATYTGAHATRDVCVLQTRDANGTQLDHYLLWEVKRNDGGMRSQNLTYEGAAANVATFLNNALVSDGSLCGQSNWRLPTATELRRLVKSNASNAPFIETRFFPETKVNNGYWTSTSGTGSGTWQTVSFASSTPTVTTSQASNTAYVRLVSAQ